jgi:hypothetical protein
MKMQSKCWLTWLPKDKDSHFHAEFFKQEGLNIKEICWEEKKSLSLWPPKLLSMSREEELTLTAKGCAENMGNPDFETIFLQGADWADSHHWYPCDGDYLPEYDEVVLVTLIWEDSEEGENESDVTFSHRSDNPRVIVDENGFAKIIDGVKYGSWCRIPKFTKK